MSAPRTIKLRSSFPAADTGKPMEYTYNLDDPEAMAEYAVIKKAWDEEGARYKASQRNVFRTKPGSPEEMQLGLQQERNLREMRKGAPQAGALAGEGLGTYLGAMTGNPALAKNLGTAGAWLGGAGGGALIGENPVSAGNEMAAYQLGGRGVAKAFKGLGGMMMRSGIDPPAWLAEKFPAVWNTALRERIGLANPRTLSEGLAETGIPGAERAGIGERLLGNNTGLTGSHAAGAKMAKAEEVVQRMLKRTQAGKPATISLAGDVMPEVRRRLRSSGALSRMPVGRMDALAEADAILTQFVTENPGAVDFVRAHQLKRGAQTEAANLLESLNSARANGSILDQSHTSAQVREKVMKEINAVLLERLRKGVPGYHAAEARVADLIGLERAMKFREAQQVGGLDVRAGNTGAIRVDPFGLFPPHLRSTIARQLEGPLAGTARIAPMPLSYQFSNLGRPKEEGQQ